MGVQITVHISWLYFGPRWPCSQVAFERYAANTANPFCDFMFHRADSWHFPFVECWTLFVHFGCWIVWNCGSNVCLPEPSSINRGYEWHLHIHTVTHTCTHTQTDTLRQRKSAIIWLCDTLQWIILDDCAQNKPDWIIRQAHSHAGSGWQDASAINWISLLCKEIKEDLILQIYICEQAGVSHHMSELYCTTWSCCMAAGYSDKVLII